MGPYFGPCDTHKKIPGQCHIKSGKVLVIAMAKIYFFLDCMYMENNCQKEKS